MSRAACRGLYYLLYRHWLLSYKIVLLCLLQIITFKLRWIFEGKEYFYLYRLLEIHFYRISVKLNFPSFSIINCWSCFIHQCYFSNVDNTYMIYYIWNLLVVVNTVWNHINIFKFLNHISFVWRNNNREVDSTRKWTESDIMKWNSIRFIDRMVWICFFTPLYYISK